VLADRIKASILIVDRQRQVIRILQTALESLRRGFAIHGVLSGEEALLEARTRPVDLLVADYKLPGMNGLELLQRIRILRPQVKSILTDSDSDPAVQIRALEAGVDAFFFRPMPVANLLAAAMELLGLPAEVEAIDSGMEHGLEKNLSERMSRLRQELNAASVILVDDHGQPLVRAGNLPETEIESSVLPVLISAHGAGQKVSRLLGRSPQRNVYFYHGEVYDFVLAAVSQSYALVAALPEALSAEKAAPVHFLVEDALQDISSILEKMGISLALDESLSVPPFLIEVEHEAEPVLDVLDKQLQTLLEQPSGLDSVEAGAFWEPDEASAELTAISADGLTYEQALQLGLAPEDD